MNDPALAAVYFIGWVSLISLLSLMPIFMWQDYQVDWYRQEMFALRDRFFDEARAGRISFDSKGYIFLRLTMNGLIRHAHIISFWEMVSIALLWKKHKVQPLFHAHFDQAVASLSPEQRALVSAYLQEMNQLTKRLVARRSIFVSMVWGFIAFLKAASVLTKTVNKASKRVSLLIQQIDDEAVGIGMKIQRGDPLSC